MCQRCEKHLLALSGGDLSYFDGKCFSKNQKNYCDFCFRRQRVLEDTTTGALENNCSSEYENLSTINFQ